MKKLILMGAFIAVIVLPASAQKIDAAKVPEAVKTSFAKQYPGVSAKWVKEEGKFEAEFKQKGIEMSVLYEANGSMAETEIEIKVADLPAGALAYMKEHYKGKKIKEGAKITKADGTVNYEAEVDGKDVLFDATGKFLKEEKE